MSAKFKNNSPIYAVVIIYLLYTRIINRLEKYSNADIFLYIFNIFEADD